MKSKGQTGVVLVVVVIIIVGVFFLYKSGYINFNSTSKVTPPPTVNPYLPIALNISSLTNLAHLYTNENINIVSNIRNSGGKYITAVLSPYGCFTPPNKTTSIPPDSSSSLSWTFSSSTPETCTITFLACFNAVSYTYYPLTIERYTFSGSVPVSSPVSSAGLPINIGLQLSNTTIVAGPSPSNQTEYVEGTALTSEGSPERSGKSVLNWINIKIANGNGYFTSSTGTTYNINPGINITQQQYPLTFSNGRLLAPVPFSLLINPVSNSLGYVSDVSVNVSAGYTYCIQSNSIPITISQS